MSAEHVIHALVRKYAELAGTLKKLNEETARVGDELNHVRATILIFQPGYRRRATLASAGNARREASRLRPLQASVPEM